MQTTIDIDDNTCLQAGVVVNNMLLYVSKLNHLTKKMKEDGNKTATGGRIKLEFPIPF